MRNPYGFMSSAIASGPVPSVRSSLRIEALEDRLVPHGSVIDLTTRGAVGSVGGTFFSQLAETPNNLDTFLTIQPRHFLHFTERGYNTDARPVQFDQASDPNATHALRLDDVPVVARGGVDYRELTLDIDQWRLLPFLSLDELRLYVSDRPDLSGYALDGSLAGQRPVFDLDAIRNTRVFLNARLNAGQGPGDMAMFIPESVLAGQTYVYLYCKFGGCGPATGGPEVWSVRAEDVPSAPARIAGLVFSDHNGNSQQDDNDGVLPGRVVYLDDNDDGVQNPSERAATTAEDGTYAFANLIGGREYIVRVVTGPGEFAPRFPITPAPGENFPLDIGVVGA